MNETNLSQKRPPEFSKTDTLSVEIPGGLMKLLERQAIEYGGTLDSYVSMLLVKGSYKR